MIDKMLIESSNKTYYSYFHSHMSYFEVDNIIMADQYLLCISTYISLFIHLRALIHLLGSYVYYSKPAYFLIFLCTMKSMLHILHNNLQKPDVV